MLVGESPTDTMLVNRSVRSHISRSIIGPGVNTWLVWRRTDLICRGTSECGCVCVYTHGPGMFLCVNGIEPSWMISRRRLSSGRVLPPLPANSCWVGRWIGTPVWWTVQIAFILLLASRLNTLSLSERWTGVDGDLASDLETDIMGCCCKFLSTLVGMVVFVFVVHAQSLG